MRWDEAWFQTVRLGVGITREAMIGRLRTRRDDRLEHHVMSCLMHLFQEIHPLDEHHERHQDAGDNECRPAQMHAPEDEHDREDLERGEPQMLGLMSHPECEQYIDQQDPCDRTISQTEIDQLVHLLELVVGLLE